jgi:hypothetical protein
MTQHIEEALAFVPPPVEDVAKTGRMTKWYFDPVFDGLENIAADRPTLLVGNHSRFGGLEMQLFFSTIYVERGVFPRGIRSIALQNTGLARCPDRRGRRVGIS